MKRERRLKAPSRKRFFKVRTLRKNFDDEDDCFDGLDFDGGGDKDKANE